MIIHQDLTHGRWFEIPLIEQLSNVGCDLDRAVRWRDKGDLETSRKAFNRALELFNFTINDPKNSPCQDELVRVNNALIDYFLGNNENDLTDEEWYDYFMFYNYMYAIQKGK